MNHLTTQAIFDLVDDRLDEKKKRELEAHLAICDGCRRATALERSVRHVIKNAPLVKATNSLSALIMVRLSTRTNDSFALRVLSKLGSIAAMALVLAVIGYAIVSFSDIKQKPRETSAYITRLASPVTELYTKNMQAFTYRTSVITQAMESKSSARLWNITFIVVLTFAVLGAADKIFGKRLTKLRS